MTTWRAPTWTSRERGASGTSPRPLGFGSASAAGSAPANLPPPPPPPPNRAPRRSVSLGHSAPRLRLMLATFDLNGSWLGLREWGGQLQVCGAPVGSANAWTR
jgi:hypothetical protein